MLGDLPVHLLVFDRDLASDVDALFHPMPGHAGPYLADVVIEDAAPPKPDREPDEVYGLISLWRSGDELVVDSGGSLRAHVTATGATIGGAMGDAADAAAQLRRIVHHVVAHLLSLNGRVVVHAAAVGRGGRALLILGGSGFGKSTSAFLASMAGWSLLSDDLVALRRAADGVDAIGIHRAVAVPAEVAGIDAMPIDRDVRDRARPTVVLDGRPHRIAAVALVEHGTAAGSLIEAPMTEVARRIVGSAPAAGHPDVASEALRAATALCVLPCFRLALPSTARDRIERVKTFLDRIAEAGDIPA
jgi:hypothetical protein